MGKMKFARVITMIMSTMASVCSDKCSSEEEMVESVYLHMCFDKEQCYLAG